MQARRLLDQVTILASGEAIVFGSAFHVPTRVRFDPPKPGPYSQTAAPFHEWSKERDPFPLAEVIGAWGLQSPAAGVSTPPGPAPVIAPEAPPAGQSTLDDEMPF